MQIRCSTCTRTIAIAADGALPGFCPHCQHEPLPGRLGAYALDRLIAAGGMGEVYLAHHTELGTEVAIKLLPTMALDSIDRVRERFAREAWLTAKVDHPGVVRVLHTDVQDDRPYLVLELVRGRTVRARLADGPVPLPEVARIAAAAADCVAAAHHHGVLHRDIKPDNLMLDDRGAVRVLDFGIARAMLDDAPLTRTGEIVGTPEYMAPEQLLGGPEEIDERTDVHALGAVLYELLTGRSPFRGANLFQTLKLVESLEPPAPTRTDEAVPAALQQVARRALDKEPARRYPNAAAFAAAVRSAAPEWTGPGNGRAHRRRSLGRPAVYMLAAGLLVTTTALVFALTMLPAAFSAGQDAERAMARDSAEALAGKRQAALDTALASGRFHFVLTSDDDSAAVRSLKRQAFAWQHVLWPRLAGLPTWLGVCDLDRRARLFGDLHEPGGADGAAERSLLFGDDDAFDELAGGWRRRGGVLAGLLTATATPPPQRADLLAQLAHLLAIDEPEHWLLRCIERHLRGEHDRAEQAAEMAWLTGAGELAVLLDAALTLPHANQQQRTRLWRRVAKADRQTCAASTLLLLWLEAHGVDQVRFEPRAAHDFPAPHRAVAAHWFVRAASQHSDDCRLRMLRVAAALGAVPDFSAAPWRDLTATARTLVEQEAARAR